MNRKSIQEYNDMVRYEMIWRKRGEKSDQNGKINKNTRRSAYNFKRI